jgi:hypothetical protein
MIAFLISLLLFAFFIYKSFSSYKSYKIAQSSDKYISFLYRCDNLLKSLEKERLLSAIYLGKNGKSDFNIVETARKSTDNFLIKANVFIDSRPDFSKDLQYVRSRVDIISDDHDSILFKYYQDELSAPIIKQLDSYTKELAFGIGDVKRDLLRYKDLIVYRNDLNKKDSFISYILAGQKKLDLSDLEILDRYIKDIKAPKEIDSKENIDTKIKVIQGATTGEYLISQNEWQNESSTISNQADSIKKDLFLNIQSTINKVGSQPKALIYYIFISLIFLISSIVFMRKFKDSRVRKVVKASMVVKKKDLPKQEIKPQHIIDNDIVLKADAPDIALSNGVESQKVEFTKTTIRSFDPMKTFSSVVSYLMQEFQKSDTGFKYSIDPDIPTHGIGNVSKIDEVFKLLVVYILDSTTSEDLIILDIENVAQTKTESAIRFTLFRNSDVVQSKRSENLTKIKDILTLIDGNFDVKEVEDGRNFIITINIKRI